MIVTLGAVGALVAPATATAGTYRAIGCEVELGALMPETAGFLGQGSRSWRGEPCDSARPRLHVGAPDGPTIWLVSPGTYGDWTMSAPAGLRFRGGHFLAEPTLTSGIAAQYFYRVAGAAQPSTPSPITGTGWYFWPPANAGDVTIDQLTLRAYCAGDAGGRCYHDGSRGDPPPGLDARYLEFQIEDYAQPAVGDLAGALMEGAAQRETQLLAVLATDAGSGIGEVEVRVNGKRYASQDPGCQLAPDGRALRLSPCPTSPTAQLPVNTTSELFAEGENALEVCVSDYAQETNDPASLAAEACATGGVYVDNSCPVSEGPDAAELRFGFGRNASRGQTVGYGKRPRVRATLDNAAGKPIEGATVCVTERDRVGRARERDVRTLKTNRRGNAKMRLPKGASRDLKLTYWSNDEDVETETARLNVRARPKLRVLSKRKLSDGGEVRFRVTLPGEYRRGRRVAVQALAPAGWLDFPGCVGRTNKKGDFACSYHFREQSGSVKYKFRALAPRQPGYPYLQGRSRSEKLIVRD